MTSQCDLCKGCGLIQQTPVECPSCHGKKCIQCKESGYKKHCYRECDKCWGSGELKLKLKKPNSQLHTWLNFWGNRDSTL